MLVYIYIWNIWSYMLNVWFHFGFIGVFLCVRKYVYAFCVFGQREGEWAKLLGMLVSHVLYTNVRCVWI